MKVGAGFELLAQAWRRINMQQHNRVHILDAAECHSSWERGTMVNSGSLVTLPVHVCSKEHAATSLIQPYPQL